uniref:Uncharacterized protein n=1 Tax=Panagrolaimus davidi TaxID=227884 RepID=A0A914QGK9_9BILA
MSSSHISHDSSNITRQIPFEINPLFFPPPTIPIPINDINPPVEFNYDFKTEHEAVIRYKKEQESIDANDDMVSRQTTIDIISKLSYLPISGSSKPKVQKENPIQERPLPSQQQTILNSSIPTAASASSLNSQLNYIQPSLPPSNNVQQQQPAIQLSSSIPASSSSVLIPGASTTYAAGLLPTWTPPQLTLDDFLK